MAIQTNLSIPTNIRKFVTTENAEMHGGAMQAFFSGLASPAVEPLIQEVLAEYGLNALDPDTWYPSQMALDLYKKITLYGSAVSDLVAIGMKFVETAPYPEDIDSIPKALNMLNDGYKMGIRNYPEDEGYTIEQIDAHHIRVYEHCPYPHDIMYGYIYGMAKRFKPEGASFKVVRTFMNPDDLDSGGAIYDVTWG